MFIPKVFRSPIRPGLLFFSGVFFSAAKEHSISVIGLDDKAVLSFVVSIVGFLPQAWYVFILLFFCNMAELNSFTLKRVFGVNKKHPLNAIRLLIHAFMSHNVILAYRKLLRGIIKPSEVPVQVWIYLLAIGLELASVLKHGPLYTANLLPNMACWLSMLFVGSILYVILSNFANFIYYGAADCKTE